MDVSIARVAEITVHVLLERLAVSIFRIVLFCDFAHSLSSISQKLLVLGRPHSTKRRWSARLDVQLSEKIESRFPK